MGRNKDFLSIIENGIESGWLEVDQTKGLAHVAIQLGNAIDSQPPGFFEGLMNNPDSWSTIVLLNGEEPPRIEVKFLDNRA